MTKIYDIKGREILDSRGVPTVEVDVILEDNSIGRASVPSGASTGKYEVFEKRDNDVKRFFGQGVLTAIKNINTVIRDTLINKNCLDQRNIDDVLINTDGTEFKNNLGGNAILGVSLACARAAANSLKLPLFEYLNEKKGKRLPVPFMNILNGGAHANNKLDFQEFMIVPLGAKSYSDALRYGAEIFNELKKTLSSKLLSTSVGDEGGFAPELSGNKEALDLLLMATEKAGYVPGKDVYFALDVASSEFYKSEKYQLKGENLSLDSKQMIDLLDNLCSLYPIISIEDGLSEDDWNGWKILTKRLGNSTQLVGDDLFATNISRLKKGIDEQIANAILIKLNQIGTLSETIDAVEISHKHSYSSMISHRSGETEDTFIADLSVAFNNGQIKTGSLSRSDRLAKYNQLIRIEEYLGSNSVYDSVLLDRFS